MGKHLAFADILEQSSKLDDKIVSVIFTGETFGNEGEPFPSKRSALACGTQVQMNIQKVDEGRNFHVLSWIILYNPLAHAKQLAQEEGNKGINCSRYLQKRGELFQNLSTKPWEATIQTRSNTFETKDVNTNNHKHHKSLRAKIFASWLVENILSPINNHVLDIAGGKGLLSMELAKNGIACTVIDPLIRKKPKMKQLRKSNVPEPHFLVEEFTSRFTNSHTCIAAQSTCLVGLHPDECTEDIIDVALQMDHVSVAVVPCCVFPSFNPHRTLKNGRFVNTHQDFCQYLMEKDARLKQSTLPFEGMNQVIYLRRELSISEMNVS